MRVVIPFAIGVLAWIAAGGCAYYNTFYTARKNFEEAERAGGDPEQRATAGQAGLYDKAITGATKILVEYADSKWVDDAVLLIGRAQLAKGDYAKAVGKFDELRTNFPKSELLDQAVFYAGVARERDRRRPEALAVYDSLLAHYPGSKLREDASYRRANLLLEMKRPADAAPVLQALARGDGPLAYRAGLKLAEALYAQGDYARARDEFERVADKAPTEALRLEARLRAGDSDEALGDYARAARQFAGLVEQTRTRDGKARAKLRLGNALALAGEVDRGLRTLAEVIEDEPRTASAAEALFRTGFLHEVVRDDFEAARVSYEKVAEQQSSSPFVAQAGTRRQNLDRLEAIRAAMKDSSGSEGAASAAFEAAELLLFQLGKPERAVEEYAKIESQYPTSRFAAKAALARGWVLARRPRDTPPANEAWRDVVARYPESEYAEVARRWLTNPADTTFALDPLPPTVLQFPLVPGHQLYVPPAPAPTTAASRPRPGTPPGSTPGAPVPAPTAAERAAAAQQAARDTLHQPSPADTLLDKPGPVDK